MKIHDITLPIHPDMLHWGRKPEVEVVESIEAGDSSNVTRWRIGTHTGTRRQTFDVTQYGSSVQVLYGTCRTHSWVTNRQVVYGTFRQRSSVT